MVELHSHRNSHRNELHSHRKPKSKLFELVQPTLNVPEKSM